MPDSELKIASQKSWLKLLSGVAIIFAIFQLLGETLKSDRGQAGVVIALIIVGATLTAEILFFRGSIGSAALRLGLGFPDHRGMLIALVIAGALLAVFPLFAWVSGNELGLYGNWLWLLPGLFAQAGIAEEVLFRGFLFGHIRQGRTFWRASMLAAIPFAVAHLFMFFILPWPIAASGIILSVAVTFPLACLFELGGRTIWPPAILHFVIQGAIKVISVSGEGTNSFPLIWISACLIGPFFVFIVPRSDSK
ncbi:MAG: lysostaphin resistance A-like protein [Pyrinomonadaceae bacterium]